MTFSFLFFAQICQLILLLIISYMIFIHILDILNMAYVHVWHLKDLLLIAMMPSGRNILHLQIVCGLIGNVKRYIISSIAMLIIFCMGICVLEPLCTMTQRGDSSNSSWLQ